MADKKIQCIRRSATTSPRQRKDCTGELLPALPRPQNNRYYSVRAANILVLVLDSALDETSDHKGNG